MSVEAEQAVLGAVLLSNDLLAKCGSLEAEHFSDPAHQSVFRAIRKLVGDGRSATPITIKPLVLDSLIEAGLDAGYIVRLAGAATSMAATGDYARMVMEDWARDEMSHALEDGKQALDTPDQHSVSDIMEIVETRMSRALHGSGARPPCTSLSAAIVTALDDATKAYHGEAGLQTGISAIDKKLGGLKRGRLYVIGGRPGMGKTTVGLALCKRIQSPAIIASLEMPASELATRLISQHLREQGNSIPYSKIENGWLSEDEARSVMLAGKEMFDENRKVEVITPDNRTLAKLLNAIKYAVRKIKSDTGQHPGLVVIDYLQLIDAPGHSANERVSTASAAIKAMAMQLDVPVVLLSQLSRAPELRDDKRPLSSDFRDSGAIEQDADVLIGCYRDEYYLAMKEGKSVEEMADIEAEKARARDRLELILLKFRQGANDTIKLHCEVRHNFLADIDQEEMTF